MAGYGYIRQLLWERLFTNSWKLFRSGVKIDHYSKLIGIRESSKRIAHDCFNNTFSPDRGTPEKNTPPLDDINCGDTVSTCRELHFSSCIYPSAAVSTISNITLNSASEISIGSHNIAEREED